MNGKDDFSKEVYEKGFGTAYETCKLAVKQSPNIRLQEVNYYLDKRDDIQVKFKYKHIIALSVQVKHMSVKSI